MHWRRKWQPTPVFLPGESQGRGSLVGCRLWGRTELDTTEATQQQQQHTVLSTIVTMFYMRSSDLIHLFEKFIHYYYFFGCSGSSLLHPSFLQLWQASATLHCGALASHRSGFCCCTGSKCEGFSSCSMWAQSSWCMNLGAPQHVESSQTKDRTVSNTGRWIPIHCTTREVQILFIL